MVPLSLSLTRSPISPSRTRLGEPLRAVVTHYRAFHSLPLPPFLSFCSAPTPESSVLFPPASGRAAATRPMAWRSLVRRRAAIYDWLGRDRPRAIIRTLKSETAAPVVRPWQTGRLLRASRVLSDRPRAPRPATLEYRPSYGHLVSFSWRKLQFNWIILPSVWFYVANGATIISSYARSRIAISGWLEATLRRTRSENSVFRQVM